MKLPALLGILAAGLRFAYPVSAQDIGAGFEGSWPAALQLVAEAKVRTRAQALQAAGVQTADPVLEGILGESGSNVSTRWYRLNATKEGAIYRIDFKSDVGQIECRGVLEPASESTLRALPFANDGPMRDDKFMEHVYSVRFQPGECSGVQGTERDGRLSVRRYIPSLVLLELPSLNSGGYGMVRLYEADSNGRLSHRMTHWLPETKNVD